MRMEDAVVNFEAAITRFCEAHFQYFLKPFFARIDDLLNMIPYRFANFFAVGLFICAMLWVCVILDKNYVNRGRPYRSVWTDLRIWTVLSMLPHVLAYFYFR